ncbi:M23 family metallopeptidase [Cryobacterium sp. TMT4-31]|uniref:M23 family metallopeptidase n=1 Tax=Cryobacterium sp. TMT4-31 TaxID=1259259 RepID=UPI0010692389|nr:M23 family metallopeptidase [Cryobacterium sp. TMT4-31]TFC90268.1 M23 family peptidase [Cryobacterium sp. TMT4-31]
MTATGRPDKRLASTRSPLHRFRSRRRPAQALFRLAALPVCAIAAALLTGAPSLSGSPAPALASAPVPVVAEHSAAASVAVPVSATLGAALPGQAAPAGWAWPVGPPRELTRPFEAPTSRYAAGHRGIDLVAGEGHPVRSPADGVVTFAGTVVDRPVLSIQHGEDLVSSFEPVTATVSEGDRVLAGQVVGVVATGSHCTARCVHFGVRRHGQYISPMLFLGGLARAILLPLPPTGPVPIPAR